LDDGEESKQSPDKKEDSELRTEIISPTKVFIN
jgi:hypothetical protein